RARPPSRVVVPREGLPEPLGPDGGARPRARTPPEDNLRGAARRAQRRKPRVRLAIARPLPQLQRRDGCADRRARAAAADVAPLLRETPGPHLLRHRRKPAPVRRAHAAAGLQGPALRDLLPLPRDRGRVLRLRARAGAAAGALAHLRHRPAGLDPEEGLPRERRAAAGVESMTAAAVALILAAAAGAPSYEVARTGAPARALLAADEKAWAAGATI